MLVLGNENTNRILEANVPPSLKKPEPETPRNEKTKWIQQKYRDRAFVAPSNLSPSSLNNVNYSFF